MVCLKDLFLVRHYSYCIDDISASSSKFEFFPLANDTNLLCKDKSLSLLESVVNEELTTVCD